MQETIAFTWETGWKNVFFIILCCFVLNYLERKGANAEEKEAIGDKFVFQFYLATLCACDIWAIWKQTKP